MAKILKCDKCKKQIRDGKYAIFTIDDYAGLTENRKYFSIDYCAKCAQADFKKLQKIFPDLK